MKIDRLLGILTQLQNKKSVTAPELAEHFEVSRRTVIRDIEVLERAGFPIVTRQGAGGGISLMEGFQFEKKLLKREDLFNIITALKGLDSVSGDSHIGQLIKRISTETEDSISIDLASHYKTGLTEKISLLKNAVRERFCVRFTYYSKNGEEKRVVEPCTILYRWSDWYLSAYCRNKEDFRMFKLNRMWKLAKTSDSFEMRKIYREKSDRDGHFHDENEIEVLFDKSVKYRVVETYGPDSFTERDDGSLLFNRGYTNKEFMVSWLLGFGDKAMVISPRSLAREIQERLKRILEKYQCYNK